MRCFLSFLLLIATARCTAQWSQSPESNNPICTAEQDQRNLCAVSDGHGGAIIVWEDLRNAATGTDIYIQRIGTSGALLWTPTGVPVCRAPGMQRRPSAVSDGLGGAIIVWDDTRSGDADIYMQRIDSSGKASWLPDGMPVCTAQWAQQYPQCVTDEAGGALVLWQDERHTGYAVYAQHVDANGVELWRKQGVLVSGAPLSCILPRALADGRGGLITVWEDGRTPQNGGDLYAQRVDGAGTLQWQTGGVAVCTALNWQRGAQLASDGHAGAIIAWQDSRSGSLADVYAQRIDSVGNLKWMTNGTGVCLLPEQQGAPEIVSDGRGGALIVWRDDRIAYAPRLFAQRLNVLGNPLWQPGGIDVCAAAQSTEKHRLVADGMGGAIIAWQDARNGGSNLNIYAQRVDSSGFQQCGSGGMLLCNAVQNQHDVRLVPTINGGCIAVWEDNRASTSSADIYASSMFQCQLIPVELLSFDARFDGERVWLQWRTGSERNNAGFEVQRAEDGYSWHPLAFVRGIGESERPSDYRYGDLLSASSATAETLFYRLRQIDTDGTSHASSSVPVALGALPSRFTVDAYPIPARGTMRVRFTIPSDATLRLSLRDLLGRETSILSEGNASRGTREYPIDVSEYLPGVYFLIASAADEHAITRILISR